MKTVIAVTLLACVLVSTAGWADGPEMHRKPHLSAEQLAASCDKDSLYSHLHEYNLVRLQLAEVLRFLADDQPMDEKTRTQLIAYAGNLDEMKTRLPNPDPSSTEFANFDFHLGLTLTAMTVFLHTSEDSLRQRFESDRDDASSRLGTYLARLDKHRAAYETDLKAAVTGECMG